MVHEIQVAQYKTVPSSIKLGTFDSYGTEQLHFTFGSGWEDLAVYATFTAPNGKSTQTAVDLEGYTDVPPEATAEQAGQGEIVLVGKAKNVNRITVSLYYTVLEHGPVQGAEPAVPKPDLLQQVLTLSKDAQEAAKNAEQSAKNAVKDATDTVKPFKEEAVQAAAAAALSQKGAAESKEAAQEAAERSVQAGIAAVNAADEAKRSAGIATGAAGNSALNAESAQKSALNAQQSAKNAAESQNAAKASADAAAKSQQSAATDAKTAADAKDAAAGSADAAAARAKAAGHAASAAAGSEQAAGASEQRASESERAAKESEQAAAKSAEAALESKNAAATSEGNAAASAKKAQGVADSLPEDYTTAVSEISKLKTDKADKAELDAMKHQVESITPDNSSVGEKPWSSKNIVDMLCPPLEESGNPVVCYPVAGYPLDVKAKWEPTQEGSGTPSPENIRPIKGRDSVKVERCGENLLNLPIEKVSDGIVITMEPDGRYHLKGTLDIDGFQSRIGAARLPAGTYAIKQVSFSTPLSANAIVITIRKYTASGSTVSWLESTTGSGRQNTNNLEQPADIVVSFYGAKRNIKKGTVIDTYLELMLVAGTTAPTTYTPYIGTTNTLTLPETVYGGEVDAVSGEGQETWKTITLDGTEDWKFQQTNNNRFVTFIDIKFLSADRISQVSNISTVNAKLLGSENTGFLVYNNPFENKTAIFYGNYGFENLDSFKNFLIELNNKGTPLQIAYKLATHTKFTATGAKPISALAGVNTVLTDADSATVTGRADPIKRIADLEVAVASQT